MRAGLRPGEALPISSPPPPPPAVANELPHQQREGRDLEEEAQLGLGGGGGDVGEHALLLDNDLEHVGDLRVRENMPRSLSICFRGV